MKSAQEIALAYAALGENKKALPALKLLLLGIFAGFFIALAGVGANTAASAMPAAGLAKLISALVFPAGLAMVVLAGSELFTGNCLLAMSVWSKKMRVSEMLRCWVIVYLGNFIGSVIIAFLMVQAQQYSLFSNAVAVFTIQTAVAKVNLPLASALIDGIFCNFLVCIAVWIAMGGTTATEKLAGLYLPIFLFVLAGFEHSVANMYYIPAGLFAAADPAYAAAAVKAGVKLTNLTWSNFFLINLLPVTIGNIIGGTGLVGGIYWRIYLSSDNQEQ